MVKTGQFNIRPIFFWSEIEAQTSSRASYRGKKQPFLPHDALAERGLCYDELSVRLPRVGFVY